MTWQKHVRLIDKSTFLNRTLEQNTRKDLPPNSVNTDKYSSYLPEVYAGHPFRIERYNQYDIMDQDPEINAALDTISDFCTHKDDNGSAFSINYKGNNPSDSEIAIIQKALQQWNNVNKFKRKIWRILRNTLKYGDQFFIRNPDTLEWNWVEPSKVEKIYVNEAEGKKIEKYVVRDVDLNFLTGTGTAPSTFGTNLVAGTGTPSLDQRGVAAGYNTQGNPLSFKNPSPYGNRSSRFNMGGNNSYEVDATHVVHLSLSEGLDASWPFGISILEPLFRVYKQKELLEDAIIIYRIQRAPERRVFYIDVGQMPPHKAQQYLERVKNEIHQRRIPTRSGGGGNAVDATYNPMSILDDYFFMQTSEGRGSKVETLPAGENLGQIDDLKFFNNKLMRGLRVPSSYLPTGPDDGTAAYTDGRVGTAYIQEFRFSRYCERLQYVISHVFDREFKLFMKQKGYSIPSNLFELEFNPPQSFGQYAQIDRDVAQIGVFQPLSDISYFSKRFLMERYLGLSPEEIYKNEKMWREENSEVVKEEIGSVEDEDTSLNTIGVRPDIESDDPEDE